MSDYRFYMEDEEISNSSIDCKFSEIDSGEQFLYKVSAAKGFSICTKLKYPIKYRRVTGGEEQLANAIAGDGEPINISESIRVLVKH